MSRAAMAGGRELRSARRAPAAAEEEGQEHGLKQGTLKEIVGAAASLEIEAQQIDEALPPVRGDFCPAAPPAVKKVAHPAAPPAALLTDRDDIFCHRQQTDPDLMVKLKDTPSWKARNILKIREGAMQCTNSPVVNNPEASRSVAPSWPATPANGSVDVALPKPTTKKDTLMRAGDLEP